MRQGPTPLQPFCSSRVNIGGLNFAMLRDTEEDGVAEISVNELKEVKLKKWKMMLMDSDLLNKAVEHCIEEKHLEDDSYNGEVFAVEEIEQQPPLALGHCHREHSPNHYVAAAAAAIHPITLTESSSD